MSFALPGARFGLARALGTDPTLSLSGITTGGAVGLGAQGVLNDPSLTQGINGVTGLPVLSPFSVMNLSMLSGVFTRALEAPLESATMAVVSALPASLLGTVAEVVGDVVDIVPVLGPFFKAAFDILSIAFGNQPAYTGSADEARDCQLYMDWFKTPQSGVAGLDPCTTCPSDLFFPSVTFKNTPGMTAGYCCDPKLKATNPGYWTEACNRYKTYKNVYPWNVATSGDPSGVGYTTPPRTYQDLYATKIAPNWEDTYTWRPAIGQALMLLTEGAVIDAFEINDPTQRVAFTAWSDQAYDAARGGFGAYLALNLGQIQDLSPTGTDQNPVAWMTYGGIPPARRAQFRALRRGIQASSRFYGLSDGGVSLWPVYMDLLLNSYDLGQITDEFIKYSLTYQFLQGALNSGACWLENQQQNEITPQQVGLMMNQNLFGAGYVAPGDTGYQISSCAQAVAGMVIDLITQWRKTTQYPATQVGAAKLAEYAAQAKAIAASGGVPGGRKYMATWQTPLTITRPGVPTVKKAHGSAALLGAATAAAAIYFFL